jgi:hypothetical protein
MELSYVTSDMMIEVTYNPTFVPPHSTPSPPIAVTSSSSNPLRVRTDDETNKNNSISPWLTALYEWAVQSDRRQHITTAIQAEFYFSGFVTMTAETTDSYPFLGNATVAPLPSLCSSPPPQISFLKFPKFSVSFSAVGGIDISSLSFLQSYLHSSLTQYFHQVALPSSLPSSSHFLFLTFGNSTQLLTVVTRLI